MWRLCQTTVFISYTREDSAVADRWYYFQKKSGCRIWMDREDITPGEWETKTRRILTRSQVIIPIVSKHYLHGDGYILHERVLTKMLLSKKRTLVFPVLTDESELPNEYKEIHAVGDDAKGMEAVLQQLTLIGRRRKIVSTIVLLCSLLLTGTFMMLLQQENDRSVSFKATVFDRITGKHVTGAKAFLLSYAGDTLIQSDTSRENGQVCFYYDTIPDTRCTIWFYHPAYRKTFGYYWLMEHEPYRQVRLDSISKSEVQEKSFAIEGLLLTAVEEDAILKTTQYRIHNGSPNRFSFTYDHSALVEVPFDEGEPMYRFTGGAVYLTGNNCSFDTGIRIDGTGSMPCRKKELEKMITRKIAAAVIKQRDKIITALLLCLHQI